MSNNIPNWFVQQWDKAIRTEAAQKDSRLMVAVTDRGSITGESFTINQLGDDGSTLKQNTVRHGDTEWTLPDHRVRVVNMIDFFEAVPLDRADVPKMLVNPVTGGNYMQNLIAKRNRTVDRQIYRALRDPALRKDGSTVALPADQKIVEGGTGMTKAKLIQARAMFRDKEVDEYNDEQLFITYNSQMLEDVLSDTTLTSSEFLAGQMLQEGKIKDFLGFRWIPYNALDKAGDTFYAMAWAKSGVHFGQGYEKGDVSPRPDKKNTTQVSYEASYGAGREDEKKVVEIAFK